MRAMSPARPVREPQSPPEHATSVLRSPASDFAARLLATAVGLGLRDIVLCPGSRSQALALVAAELEQRGDVRLHVRIDERSAAFFALGLVIETGTPVPVITTSGTAVANLHPAMLEAFHSGLPLIALTADRPAELIGVGANQATVQPGMLGPRTRAVHVPAPEGSATEPELARSLAARMMRAKEPLHLNIAFRDPLSGTQPDLGPLVRAARDAAARGAAGLEVPGPEVAGLGLAGHAGDAAGSAAEPAGATGETAGPGAAGPGAAGGVACAHATRLDDAAGLAAGAAGAAGETAGWGASEPGDAAGAGAADPGHGVLPGPGASGAERVPLLEIDPADGVPTVVVAGTGAGAVAEQIAHDGGWPLLAEVTSGARFGRNLVTAYRELLGEASPVPAARDAVRRIIVFGHPTLSRGIPRLLARPGLDVIIAGPTGGEPYDPGRSARVFASELRLVPGRRGDERWLREWVLTSRRLSEAAASDAPPPDVEAARSASAAERSRFARDELAILREPVSREVLADAVWRATWPHDRLVLGASRLVRELDRRAPGKRVRVIANRGQAGIDGTVATALGIATASQLPADQEGGAGSAGITRVLLGDLTLLHDASSLLTGQGGEAAPRVQLIVGNDGGGTIFDGLEVASVAAPEAMTRVMLTPQRVDMAALAAAYDWAYRLVTTRGELEAALTAHEGRVLIEVPLPR